MKTVIPPVDKALLEAELTPEKFVRKTVREKPAKIAVIKRVVFGAGFQQAHRAVNRIQQFIAQARALGFIP